MAFRTHIFKVNVSSRIKLLRKTNDLVLIGMVLILFIVFITQQSISVFNKYHINGDLLRMYYIHDFPNSLRNDINAQNTHDILFGPTVIYNFYFFFFINKFVDFVIIKKILVIIIFLVLAYFLYKLGILIKNEKYALILLLLFMLFIMTNNQFVGAYGKAFIYPLLVSFLYYLIKKDILKISIITILQTFLYPPILLVSLGIFCFSIIDFKNKRINIDLKKNGIFYISLFICLTLLISFSPKSYLKRVTLMEAVNMPEFFVEGRYPIFRGNPSSISITTPLYLYDVGIRKPLLISPLFIIGLLTIIMVFIYKKTILDVPKEVYFMIISAILFALISTLVFSLLYFPNRYLRNTIPLFLIIILSNGLYFLYTKYKYRSYILIMIMMLIFIPQVKSAEMYCQDRELYEFIKKLPKDSLIAGHPADMDCIAFFGRKTPFVTDRSNDPIILSYYKPIQQRIFEFFKIYYAEDGRIVKEFCLRNKVTHIVVNKRYFSDEYLRKEKIDYWAPYNDFLKNLTSNKTNFYLVNQTNIIFKVNDKFIKNCE